MTGNYEINVSNNSTVLDLVNALKKVGMSTENILDVLLYFNSLGVIDAKIVVLE